MPKEKPKKKIRSKDDSSDTPKKRKKKVGSKSPKRSKGSKANKSPAKTWGIRILIVVAAIGGFDMVQKSNEAKAISKTYMVSLAALNKLQISCAQLWSEVGIEKACDQDLAEKAIGKYNKDVKLTVVEGRSHKFTAQVKHKMGDKIFQVNKKGDLFLNHKGCLAKLRVMNPDPEDIQKLERSCKAPAP